MEGREGTTHYGYYIREGGGGGGGGGAVVSCKTVVRCSTLPRVHGTQCMRFLVDSNCRSILDKLYYVPGTFCKMSYEFGSY